MDDDHDEAPMAVPLSGILTKAADSHMTQSPPDNRNIPVTLVTGFLGSGKTSLIRHVLTGDHGLRVAVIMNEFGESVEESYFHTPEGKAANLGEWISLANGCMCCQVKSEFVQAIETLMSQETKSFDYILIETSGLADPGPVAASLWTDKDLESGVMLDSIITVVDCLNIDRQLRDTRPDGAVNEAQVQLAYADLILLNKMDLCDEEAIVRSEADIRAINSSVIILRTTKCEVDLEQILHRKNFAAEPLDMIAEGGEDEEEPSTASPTTPSVTAAATIAFAALNLSTPSASEGERGGRLSDSGRKDRGSGGRRCSEDEPMSSVPRNLARSKSRSRSMSRSRRRSTDGPRKSPHHDCDIGTITLRTSKPLDLEKFKSFMDRLLWDRDTHPEDIYRVKGELSIANSDSRHMVQAVYELYSISPSTTWDATEARASKIVLIGRHLKKEILTGWLVECET